MSMNSSYLGRMDKGVLSGDNYQCQVEQRIHGEISR
jgi:hypothetical protein